MEEKGKSKKFVVTQSLRFPTKSLKIFYYVSIFMIAAALVAVAVCMVTRTKGVILGLAAVVGVLGIIWIVSVHFISENSFGLARISFGDEYILFTNVDDKYKLLWDNVVECGIEKTRRAYWVYASDHKVSDAEKVEFPENVKEGVFYFNYYWNTWEEFMKFVPEKFKPELEARKAELKISD